MTTNIGDEYVQLPHAGEHQFTGTSQLDGIAAACMVRLYLRNSGVLVRATRSASDGAFSFSQIAYQQYFIAAFQDLPSTPQFNIRALDDIYPVAM